ncbi:MAG: LD-carboxypeptidase, partial [Clostridium sp.]
MNTTINKIALVACSNPYKLINKPKLNNLVTILSSMNLEVVVSPFIFEDKSTPSNRANIFMEYMLDPSISIIFDISGGDLCNEILDFIDFDKLKENTTLYCGYSDNSVLINALYAKCNITSLNYQITRL